MRRRSVILCALLGIAVAAAAGRVSAEGTPATGCFVRPPGLNAAKTKVIAAGYCLVRGKRVSASLRYGVSQEDASRYPCGKTLTGSGSSAPLTSGIYKATATFQAVSRAKVGGRYIRSKPVTKSFVIGGQQLQCGKLDPADPPGFAQVCDYQFSDPAFPQDNCGSVIKTPGSDYTGQYPMWSSKPRLVNFTVFGPSFVSPSGNCRAVHQIPKSKGFTWMGNTIFTQYYECSDGLEIAPLVSIFYYAPGTGANDPPTCSFNNRNLNLGGEYSQFTLPQDSAGWGGTLDVVWKMLVSYNNGPYVSHMFADKSIRLGGSQNACAELSMRS